MSLKLLAVGDIHLGRQPSRLPEELAERAGELGPAEAWFRIVQAAIEQSVDAVLLAGDVVERDQDFFEAYRLLLQGTEDLTRAGIRVLGIAGNHDVAVLPRLAEEIPTFELLGRNGVWQARHLSAGHEQLTLWGWSFTEPRISQSPLIGMEFDRGPGPNLGLLHCDRDQTYSCYAPVTRQQLETAGLDGWLLGHIHRPDTLTAAAPSGYLGSVTGLDAGEPGPHGPWFLEIEAGRIAAVQQWPLAPLRWEQLEVDVTDIAHPAEARSRLLSAVHALDESLQGARWRPRAVGLRVRFTGRSDQATRAVEALFPPDERAGIHDNNGLQYFIERLEVATLPPMPLDELATRSDPPGLLAQRLLVLDRTPDDSERSRLIQAARARLAPIAEENRWQHATTGELDDERVADWLQQAARMALERLLAQPPTE